MFCEFYGIGVCWVSDGCVVDKYKYWWYYSFVILIFIFLIVCMGWGGVLGFFFVV